MFGLNVGDTVYQHDAERVYELTITGVIYETDGIAFDSGAIGKSIQLTREAAEESLRKYKRKTEASVCSG